MFENGYILHQHSPIICCAGHTKSVMMVPKQSASLYLLSQEKLVMHRAIEGIQDLRNGL